jgi:hypothetical protein
MFRHTFVAGPRVIRGLLFCLAALLAGCAVNPIWYQIRPNDTRQSVVLRLEEGVVVVTVDGRRLVPALSSWDGSSAPVRELRIIPGRHEVMGYVGQGGVAVAYLIEQEFTAGSYQISPQITGYQVSARLRRLEAAQ